MAVYFIQAGPTGDVKIGYAKDPAKRLRHLGTGSSEPLHIIRLFEGEVADEMALHRRFAAYRGRGEWFKPIPEILTGEIPLAPMTIPDPLPPKAPTRVPRARSIAPEIGLRLRETRLAAGLTQVECSQRFGSPGSWNWCNWETGDHYPDPAVMVAFCEAVGTTMDWLYRGIRA